MSDTQVTETQVGAEASAAVANGGANGAQDVANLKDVLGPIFGTEFKTDEDALKSVVNAKNMSGKVGQLEQQLASAKPSTSPELAAKVAELESSVKQSQFFNENPQFNTTEAKTLIAAMGGNAADVVKTDAFKLAFDAVQKSNEIEKSKSILHSNPRLGAATDKMTQAQTAMANAYDAAQKGDYNKVVSSQREAANNAVSAVIEAYETK